MRNINDDKFCIEPSTEKHEKSSEFGIKIKHKGFEI
jgi:hypothetical protein